MNDLISRQELIDRCNDVIENGFLTDSGLHPIAVEAVKYVVENMPSAQQWIPCSERLPEEEKNKYWICTDTEYQCQCRWTNDNLFWHGKTTDWHWNIFDIPQYSKVVAWMSLPEPWGGENNEQIH